MGPRTVWGVFCQEMLIPYFVETLLDVYDDLGVAEKVKARLNSENNDPLIEDEYGPLQGKRFEIHALEVKSTAD